MPKIQDLIIGVVGLAGSVVVHLGMILLFVYMCWFLLQVQLPITATATIQVVTTAPAVTITATQTCPTITATPNPAFGVVKTESVAIIAPPGKIGNSPKGNKLTVLPF